MNPDAGNNYSRWSREELQKAETTARRFLEDNAAPIADTMRAKMRFMELLIHRLSLPGTSLDQRLDCLARLGEIAENAAH